MNSVYLDPVFGPGRMLREVYDGQIIVHAHSPATERFVRHARDAIAAAFAGFDPLTAQHRLEVEEFVDRFAPLKSSFIHDPESRVCIRALLQEKGFDSDDTYIDVPRLRVATSHGYLTSGVAYAHHPHRDTWYSAPMMQINWWLPVFEFAASAGMAFHPRYWSRPVQNGSSDFDYYRWNAQGRAEARKHVRSDTRVQPKSLEELELEQELRLVLQPGDVMMFSAAQLHSTCANESGNSRWSIDFRTVSLVDVVAGRGARNLDSSSTGTSLRDFVRMRDFAPMPDDVARLYDDRSTYDGTLVFSGPGAS